MMIKLTCIENSRRSLVVGLFAVIILLGSGVLWGKEGIKLPEWFYEMPVSEGFVYGIGISDSGLDSAIDAYLQAVDRARVMLSFCNSSECQSMTKQYEYEENGSLVDNISVTARLSSLLLAESSIEVVDRAEIDNGVVMVLAKFDSGEIETLLSELELRYYIQEANGENFFDTDWDLRLISDNSRFSFKADYQEDSANKQYYGSKSGDIAYPKWDQANNSEEEAIVIKESTALLDGTESSLNSAYWRCFISGVSRINSAEAAGMTFEAKGVEEMKHKMVSENELVGLQAAQHDFWGEKGEQKLVMQVVLQANKNLKEVEIEKENDLYNKFKAFEAFEDNEEEQKVED
jgi:hypothetical protein